MCLSIRYIITKYWIQSFLFNLFLLIRTVFWLINCRLFFLMRIISILKDQSFLTRKTKLAKGFQHSNRVNCMYYKRNIWKSFYCIIVVASRVSYAACTALFIQWQTPQLYLTKPTSPCEVPRSRHCTTACT